MRKAEVVLEMPVDSRVRASLGRELEVSLDCSYCRRTMRTVVFTLGAASARCCPGSAKRSDEDHPPFSGRLVELNVSRDHKGAITALYRLDYEASRFTDARYGSNVSPWTGHPTWGRVSFTLTCPRCGSLCSDNVQNNLVRPFTHACPCGYNFFTERQEMPLLRWLDPETEKWVQVPERFGT